MTTQKWEHRPFQNSSRRGDSEVAGRVVWRHHWDEAEERLLVCEAGKHSAEDSGVGFLWPLNFQTLAFCCQLMMLASMVYNAIHEHSCKSINPVEF